MDALRRLGAGTVCLMNAAMFFSSAMAAEEGTEAHSDPYLQTMEWQVVVAAVVGVCVAVVVVYTLIACTDCYNSEVSTDSHPASAAGARKWGGAGGYSAAAFSDVSDSVLEAGFTGEVVVPGYGSDQPLPYTMVPTQVPEAPGFRGYSAPESANVSGLGGYGSTGAHQPYLAGYEGSRQGLAGSGYNRQGSVGSSGAPPSSLAGYGASSETSSRRLSGAHVPVMTPESQEPPPPYSAASWQH